MQRGLFENAWGKGLIPCRICAQWKKKDEIKERPVPRLAPLSFLIDDFSDGINGETVAVSQFLH